MASGKKDDLFDLDKELDMFDDEDNTEEENAAEEEYDGDEYDEDEYDGEEPVGTLDMIKAKAAEIIAAVDDKAYEICMEPDKKTLVGAERSKLIVITATVLALLIALGSILYCGLYPWHTTGVKAKDFIRCFNEIVVNEDINAVFENYQDITIPEKAKLGGKHEIAIYDGHVIISADVSPTGYIRTLDARVEDLPGFDEEKHAFVSGNNEDCYYFYVAIGKIIVALQQAYTDTLPEPEITVSSSSVASASDADSGRFTAFDAAVMGYQVISYAALYNNYGYADEYTMDFGNMHIAYSEPKVSLSVTSSETTIAKLPEGLQKLFEKKQDEPEEEAAGTVSAVVSAGDVSEADAAQ